MELIARLVLSVALTTLFKELGTAEATELRCDATWASPTPTGVAIPDAYDWGLNLTVTVPQTCGIGVLTAVNASVTLVHPYERDLGLYLPHAPTAAIPAPARQPDQPRPGPARVCVRCGRGLWGPDKAVDGKGAATILNGVRCCPDGATWRRPPPNRPLAADNIGFYTAHDVIARQPLISIPPSTPTGCIRPLDWCPNTSGAVSGHVHCSDGDSLLDWYCVDAYGKQETIP
ncbi:hypothetical protein HYH03_013580 [Edaphochlamys debaryana]|uniref:Uncharacterized protein n=1 Tax=Edaphochlamys debaryana TaxID=47281 RepID=A0A835XW21_9CHLO|nr:hypothetical protein HYH03_013580 [Edaphochlamys debaryana]|eukprot:KAG2487865.1 hypothetical protein HYH03_013580 [Edaphochlamys debaryana]